MPEGRSCGLFEGHSPGDAHQRWILQRVSTWLPLCFHAEFWLSRCLLLYQV